MDMKTAILLCICIWQALWAFFISIFNQPRAYQIYIKPENNVCGTSAANLQVTNRKIPGMREKKIQKNLL